MQIYERIMDVMRNIQKEEIVDEKPQGASAEIDRIRKTSVSDQMTVSREAEEPAAKSCFPMIVAMQESATEEQIQAGDRPPGRDGLRSTPLHRRAPDGAGRGGRARGLRYPQPRSAARGAGGTPHQRRPTSWRGAAFRPEGTIVELANGVEIGGNEVVVMAGPCSVESREQIFTVAEQVAKAGARVLRGGAFKPRSLSVFVPGHGRRRPEAVARGRQTSFGLLVISEVMEISQIRADAAVRRHLPGGRAQHAEFQSAARTGQGHASRCC